ncbi:MAG: hypothetical protein QXW97_03490 [Candidatus Pacearchaeota archaeon]
MVKIIKKKILINKKDKKAWLRIIEAFLAVLIVFSAIIIVIANKESRNYLDKIIYEKEEYILNLIQKNETLRSYIMIAETCPGNPGCGFSKEVNDSIYPLIPRAWDYGIKICELDYICVPDNAPLSGKEVYYSERLFVSSISNKNPFNNIGEIYSPRKIVLGIWSK